MPMDKSMLDKMQMPKKAGEDDEMLAYEEGEAEGEMGGEASGMDLAAIPDEELLAELKKRGLAPGGETEVEVNMDGEDSEEEMA